jgi:hypothetical protein
MFITKNVNILFNVLLQRVPNKYVEKYWKGISNPIFLRFPNGVEQKIFWKESNGDVCFQKNWENFAKPLKYGSLLTFKHIGGPYFKVKIFGFNAVEINYLNIKSVEDNEEDVEGAAAKEVIDLSEDDCEDEFEGEDEFDDETDDEFEEQPQRRTSKRKVHVDLESSEFIKFHFKFRIFLVIFFLFFCIKCCLCFSFCYKKKKLF